jgi:hypothetical protein
MPSTEERLWNGEYFDKHERVASEIADAWLDAQTGAFTVDWADLACLIANVLRAEYPGESKDTK